MHGLGMTTYVRSVTRKLWTRISEQNFRNKDAYFRWLESRQTSFERYASERDSRLLEEALEYERKLHGLAEERKNTIPVDLGGNAYVRAVYFETRLRAPETIVETGVASGYSSRAMLEALRKNGRGLLYSSDLPYLRQPSAEKYIGHLVDPDLRENWHLYLEGDRVNLPKIAEIVSKIDLFHYDSDKSKSGRRFACRLALPKMVNGGILIMDDIQDNDYFEELASELQRPTIIFKTRWKYVGLIEM